MNQYKILSVQEDELEACAETVRAAFGITAAEFGFTKENYPSGGAFITRDVLAKAKERGVHMYAAWVDGKVAGYVQLEKKEGGVYSFQKFAVLPQYQQLGIGRALIAFCRNKAEIYGGRKLSLIMVDRNEKLKLFYQSNGFQVIGTKTDPEHPFLQALLEMELSHTNCVQPARRHTVNGDY